jgi:hypothetical protein
VTAANLSGLLAAISLVAIAVILGRLHDYYLDENERIGKGQRRFDH